MHARRAESSCWGIGSGTVPLFMTHTRDVGRFVVASLSLPKWEKRSFIVGDRKSWYDVVDIAGKITGTIKTLLGFELSQDIPVLLIRIIANLRPHGQVKNGQSLMIPPQSLVDRSSKHQLTGLHTQSRWRDMEIGLNQEHSVSIPKFQIPCISTNYSQK